jgi:hypothetical protein
VWLAVRYAVARTLSRPINCGNTFQNRNVIDDSQGQRSTAADQKLNFMAS